MQGFSLPGPSLVHFFSSSALDGLGCFSLSHLPYFRLLLTLLLLLLLYLECSSIYSCLFCSYLRHYLSGLHRPGHLPIKDVNCTSFFSVPEGEILTLLLSNMYINIINLRAQLLTCLHIWTLISVCYPTIALWNQYMHFKRLEINNKVVHFEW